jgi:hypothetical protein
MFVSKRPEQEQVQDGLEDAHDHPDRVAQAQRERSLEDEPGVSEWFASSVSPAGIRRGAVSRSERPVFLRKTSSRLGRWRFIVEGARPLASSRRRTCGTASSPRSTYRRTRPSSRPASRTNGCGQQLHDLLAVAVDADRQHVAGDLALELARRALGDDLAVVDDRQAVAQRVRLLEVVGREEDGGAGFAELADLLPQPRPACGSRPVVGSSRKSSAGRWTMPMPMLSRRRMPPE